METQDQTLINLTGRTLHLYRGGRKVRTIEAQPGPGYRFGLQDLGVVDVDGIDVCSVAYKPSTLPQPQPGVWLIVSQVAAAALALAGQRRHDVLFPGPGVTDRGQVVGCRGLMQLVTP